MEGLIIFVVIVLLSTAIGAVSQVLKGQQQAEQARAARARANSRAAAAPVRTNPDRPAANPIDKFLEEIDRLRQKGAESNAPPPPPAQPVARRIDRDTPVEEGDRNVPTVRPARKPRLETPERPVPVATRVARPEPPATRVEDLPVAPVIPSPTSVTQPPPPPAPPQRVTPAAPTGSPRVTKPIPAKPRTAFGNQIVGLLSSPQSVPLAFVLQEVLGPPKCKRG